MDPSNFSGKSLWLLASSATITAGANAHHQFKQTRILQFREAYQIVKDYSEGKISKDLAIEAISYTSNKKFATQIVNAQEMGIVKIEETNSSNCSNVTFNLINSATVQENENIASIQCGPNQSLTSLPYINFRLYTTLGELDFDFSLLTEKTITELLVFLKLAPTEIQKIQQNVREIRTQNSFDRVCIIDPISYQISPMNQYVIFSSTLITNAMTGLLVGYTVWNRIQKFLNSKKA